MLAVFSMYFLSTGRCVMSSYGANDQSRLRSMRNKRDMISINNDRIYSHNKATNSAYIQNNPIGFLSIMHSVA